MEVALERVAFQNLSPLAIKTIALCQKAIDDLKASRKTPSSGKFVQEGMSRITEATKFLNKTFVPDLVKLCKEELNLYVEVELYEEIGWGNAAMYILYKNYPLVNHMNETTEKGFKLFSGTTNNVPTDYDREYYKKYSENLDLDVSKLKEYTTEHKVFLWFYSTSFMTEEFIDPNLIPQITAEEMAGTILHELGHAMTMIEHLADVYNRTELATNTITYLNQKADNKTLVKSVDDISESDTKDNPDLSKAVQMMRSLGENLELLVSLPIIVPIVVICSFFDILFVAPLGRLISDSKYGLINSKFEKTSDTVVTKSNDSYVERIADEFVTRHGLLSAYITGFLKEQKYIEIGHIHDTFTDTVNSLGLIKTVLMSYKIIFDFISPAFWYGCGSEKYDPDWLRYDHILQDALVVFKNDNLSQESRDYFLKETKMMIELIDKFKNQKRFKLKQFFWGTIFRILSRTSVADAFTTANLSADYDKLQLMTNGMIKNRLYYQAARLKSL